MAEANKHAFRRWTASSWANPDLSWREARYVTVGIDVGSVSAKAVIMTDGEIYAYGSMRTGFDSPGSAVSALALALQAADGMTEERMNCCVGTGYGRVNVPHADRTINEIACHARGAGFIYGPRVRTVLDVGGQDIKAIRCDEKGKVNNFLINDKCAAGTGRGMEVLADLLNVPVDEVGALSFDFQGKEPKAVSNACVVYAKTEALGLLRNGWSRGMVLAAYCRAMAEQIYSLLERLGVETEFAVTGGLAKNRGIMDRLMPMIGIERLKTKWDPQIAGAVGAALFGYAMCLKGRVPKKLGKG